MFYIKKVGLAGQLGDSSLDLSTGLNVVVGSSNTGKSIIVECIDYALGDKDYNIELPGYDSVYVVLSHERGDVKVVRKLGVTTVDIESSNPLVPSGTYPIKKKSGNKKNERYLDDFLLILNDVKPRQDIIISKDWGKQNFTFRTCLNSFIVKQENIIRRESPFLPLNNSAQPAFKSGLLYLWTGENFLNDNDKDNMRIRRARKSAVETYVSSLLETIKSRRDELIVKASLDPEQIETKIEETLQEISENEQKLNSLFEENRRLSQDIIELDDQISECENLLIKYEALKTQYEADSKRLQLVIEGEMHEESEDEMVCPFCSGRLEKSVKESCAEAASKELLKLAPKVKDLQEASESLSQNKQTFIKQRDELKGQKAIILKQINQEVKPLITKLEKDLAAYKVSIEDAKEAKMLLEQEKLYEDKIKELEVGLKDENTTFDVMSKYTTIIEKLTAEYNRLLTLGNYKHNSNAVFEAFDFVIDGKHKRTQGQGYRAYLNGLAVYALYNCLHNEGVYPMPFLVMDSPIQSLVENNNIAEEESMKLGLFKCLKETPADKQVIVIENSLPTRLDYSSVNLLYFTKDEETGRYGFAKGITN